MSKLGEEATTPDGRVLRVVRLSAEARETEPRCEWCALYSTRLGSCTGGLSPFDCVTGGLAADEVAVFVDDIPVLAMKGILA